MIVSESVRALSQVALMAGLAACTAVCLRGADKLSVAAASNLVFALEELHPAFARAEPGIELQLVTGASGSLVSQIRNGAPYDVFLSADMEFPRALVASGDARSDSLVVIAVGRLVLWTTRERLELPNIAALRSAAVSRIAIATPETAPYGRAAQEALVKLELWDVLQPRLVFGENISQTAQYVETGNADVGFVALALVLSPRLENKGRWIEVPPELYASLEQGAVITSRGAENPAARRYLEFLRSTAARATFERFGYRVP